MERGFAVVMQRGCAASEVGVLVGAPRMLQQPRFPCSHARACVREPGALFVLTTTHAGVWLRNKERAGCARRACAEQAARARRASAASCS